MTEPGRTSPEPPTGGSAAPGRRAVIAASLGAAGLAVMGATWWATRGNEGTTGTTGASGVGTRSGRAAPSASALPRPVSAATLPAGVEVGVDGIAPFRVPNEDFFQIDTTRFLPRLDPTTWRLRIHGMVQRELRVTLADLLGRPMIERDITLSCVSNEVGGDLIGNASWLGTRIAPILAEAGPAPDADMVLSTSYDGWTASTPLEVLTDDRDALLAIGMNGEPLPDRHGYPVRMIVPGLYGFVSATKWVVDLELTRFDRAKAYWSTRGWSDHGPAKLSSRIDVPRPAATVRAGAVSVGGVAWAPHTGIARVQVRVDDGPWQPARLGAAAGADTWRQWAFAWDAPRGDHSLTVRAVDAAGQVQTGKVSDVVPDGATGWHTVTVTVG